MKNEKKENIYSKVTIPVPIVDVMILAGIGALILLVVSVV